jgi:hypothetical protein
MVTLDIFGQVYAVSAAVGTAFLALSVLSGRIGHGHGASSHSALGHHSPAHGAGLHHGPAHGSGLLHGASHSASVGHASAHAARVGHSLPTNSDNQSVHTSNLASTGPNSIKAGPQLGRGSMSLAHLHPPSTSDEELAEKIFALVNPFFLAIFLIFFGLTGLLVILTNKSISAFSLIPAIGAGLFVNWLLKAFIGWMFVKLESSSSANFDEIIGQPAAVSVPIAPERVGEITYIVQSKRYNYPAKGVDPTAQFKRGTQVIISDVADSIAYVESWTDSFEPGFKDILPSTQAQSLNDLTDKSNS